MELISELKRRNVFKVAVAYLVAAWLIVQLIAAWALELTPEGIKLEKHVDRSQSITPQTGHKLNGLIIGVLALAVVVLLVDKVWLSGAGDGAASAGG